MTQPTIHPADQGDLTDAIFMLADAIYAHAAITNPAPAPKTAAWPEGIQGEDPAVLEALAKKPEPIDLPLYRGVPIVDTSVPIREPIVGDFSDETWSQEYADMGEVPAFATDPSAHEVMEDPFCPFCYGGRAA